MLIKIIGVSLNVIVCVILVVVLIFVFVIVQQMIVVCCGMIDIMFKIVGGIDLIIVEVGGMLVLVVNFGINWLMILIGFWIINVGMICIIVIGGCVINVLGVVNLCNVMLINVVGVLIELQDDVFWINVVFIGGMIWVENYGIICIINGGQVFDFDVILGGVMVIINNYVGVEF